jgi:putative sterol carrier protein
MADTTEFFNTYLPNKLKDNPDLADMGVTFQFDIDGAGTWSLHLKDGGSVAEGATDDADCVVSCAKDDWEGLLDNPANGMMLFMQGKLKATNLGLATKLQQILG